MDVNEAWEKAKSSENRLKVKIQKKAWDDGKYFVFAVAEDDDLPPLGVDKKTGRVIVYFPFDHMPEFDKAVRVL